MALLGGADDAGSTMMEENVVSASGTKKLEASEVELQDSIRRAGFIPQRRNSDYDELDTPLVAQDPRQMADPTPNASKMS